LCLIFGSAGYTPVTGDWNESRTTTVGAFQDDIWQLDSTGSGQFDDCTTVECLIFWLAGRPSRYRPVVINGLHVTDHTVGDIEIPTTELPEQQPKPGNKKNLND